MKLVSLGGFNNVGKKAEIIAQGKQGILMHPGFIIRVKVSKDPSVLSQQSMNISDNVV